MNPLKLPGAIVLLTVYVLAMIFVGCALAVEWLINVALRHERKT